MTAEECVARFAAAVVEREFEEAQALLAPWVVSVLPEGGLKRIVRRARGDNPPAAEFEISSLPYNTPASMRESAAEYTDAGQERSLTTWDGGGGDFGPPSFSIPAEITDDDFRGVWQIQFQPDEDLEAEVDYSYALYVAVVELGAGLVIGYLEPVD